MNQKLKSEETQKRIIEGAFDLFYEKGYHNTSIPEIMAETKLTKGAFYHHFTGKNDIGKQVINQIVTKRIYDGMIRPLEEAQGTNVLQTLKDVFTVRIMNFTEEEKKLGCPANNLINELGCSEQAFRAIFRKLIDSWIKVIVNLLEQGKKNGEVRADVNPSAAAVHLVTSFEGVRGIRKVYDDDTILEEYTQGVSAFIAQLK
ncbi:TetR/AcrR family transcriptional regulator [Flagellimonas marina]|uniref:TetR/AcrR family transcriptional regulator n=1 Tax=Flagellimonas marina TaxID=1775168 RepID=A0ABV8PPX4_9FLAO